MLLLRLLLTPKLILLATLSIGVAIPLQASAAESSLLAQQIAQNTEAQQAEAQRLMQEGNAQFEQQDVDGAIAAWQEALALFQQLGDPVGEANALGNLGYVANAIGVYDQAIPLYQAALGLARDTGESELELNFLANLGLAHSSLDQSELALIAYGEALTLARSQGNRAGEGAIAGGLATTYEQVGDYERALEFYQLMLDVATEQGDTGTAEAAQTSIERVNEAIANP